ncbi:hypothetical protein E2320_022237 [Naja naja]|nr:hypothetical protein E2320_022237 [Naja naja]
MGWLDEAPRIPGTAKETKGSLKKDKRGAPPGGTQDPSSSSSSSGRLGQRRLVASLASARSLGGGSPMSFPLMPPPPRFLFLSYCLPLGTKSAEDGTWVSTAAPPVFGGGLT